MFVIFSVWNGVLFIRQGLYQEGVFKFKLVIPENYPDGDCPVSSVPRSHQYFVNTDNSLTMLKENKAMIIGNIVFYPW